MIFRNLQYPATESYALSRSGKYSTMTHGENAVQCLDLFRLAHSLAASVLDFHKVNWLLKVISSFNIVFFYPQSSSWDKFMDAPYFMGFLSSRVNDEFAFTEG